MLAVHKSNYPGICLPQEWIRTHLYRCIQRGVYVRNVRWLTNRSAFWMPKSSVIVVDVGPVSSFLLNLCYRKFFSYVLSRPHLPTLLHDPINKEERGSCSPDTSKTFPQERPCRRFECSIRSFGSMFYFGKNFNDTRSTLVIEMTPFYNEMSRYRTTIDEAVFYIYFVWRVEYYTCYKW